MKEYGELLRDDPQYAVRAREFAARCRDVSELLAELEPRAPRQEIRLRVAYHDACHLQHAQGIRSAPRRLLHSIPGVEVREIAESEICCGSAGTYNLLQPDLAAALRDRKLANIALTRADLVAAGNIGCITQLAGGSPLPVVHTVELLDWATGGPTPRALPSAGVSESPPAAGNVGGSAPGSAATAAAR